MGALKKFQPTGTMPIHDRDSETRSPISATVNQEETLATVMMTQLYDTQVKVKFNRLLLMGQNDRVTSTYPLNRDITNIGRSRRNHIRIKDPLVSVKHLTVSVSGNTCVVNDLDSSNGTFINGERLIGGRVLRDGEEIVLGKTVLRFAARRVSAPARQVDPQKKNAAGRLNKKRTGWIVAAMLFLLLSTTLVYLGTHIASDPSSRQQTTIAKQTKMPTRPETAKSEKVSQVPTATGKKSDTSIHQAPPTKPSPIQAALEDYTAGRLDSAEKTLTLLIAAKEISTEALQAKRILSKVKTVQKLHAQALGAQKQKHFVRALGYWDRLLIVDMELVGDRPSYFATRAEQTVQTLSYEQALAAYRSKNHEKARQLCRIILKINPGNSNALTLLAKMNPKA